MNGASPDRVSIVTVTCNAAAVLEPTIQSVLAQDYPNIEYLLIDGGSTDGTLDIVERYRDRIDVLVSESDEGIFDAMNKSLKLLSGDWVNFMNAGDSFVDDAVVSRVLAQADDADFLCGDSYLIYENQAERIYEKATGIGDIWHGFMPCVHQSLFVRTDWMRQARLDTQYRLAADYDLMLRSYNAGKRFRFLDFPVSNFLVGGASKQSEMRLQVESLGSGLRHSPSASSLTAENVFLQGLTENYQAIAETADGAFSFNRKFQRFMDSIESLTAEAPRIAIYGAGTVGRAVSRLIPEQVVMVVDRSPKPMGDVAVKPVEALQRTDEYDAVLITVLGREAGIIKDLKAMQIPKEKLRTFSL